MGDEELIEQINAGDEEAAEALVLRYYPSILRYCRWHSCSEDAAQDLTQETFLKLFRSLPRYEKKNHFRTYLYTIARRLCIDESRKNAPVLTEDMESVEEARESGGILEAEERLTMERRLACLMPEQREAVLLRFGEDMRYPEIAKITGCPARTVQSRVRSALKVLRKEGVDGER